MYTAKAYGEEERLGGKKGEQKGKREERERERAHTQSDTHSNTNANTLSAYLYNCAAPGSGAQIYY
jgi:hypothetical protein